MKIGKAKPAGIAGVLPARKKGDPEREPGFVTGCPTKYRPEYCRAIVVYFAEADSWEINMDMKGSAKPVPHSKLPTFERFAAGIGVSMDALENWREKYPEFREAFYTAKSLQKAFLMELGAAGVGNHTLALILRTHHGMKDEKEEKSGGDEPIQKVVVEVVGANPHKGN